MSTFNKLLKSIILENNLSMPVAFPESFDYADYGLEFIFDIMPTFGPEYQWHTVEDLQAIPELVTALQNSPKDVIINIADGFNDAADAEENEYKYIGEDMQQPQNFREISRWIQSMAINGNVPIQAQVETTPISEDESENIIQFSDELENQNQNIAKSDDELNAYDSTCIGTPDVIKERRPRPYRRGLKALSIANRHKFNQTNNIKVEPTITKQVSQQPITKDTILPPPGVNRPLKLNNTFMDNVYKPSITNLTKETKAKAKARCKKLVAENTTDLEFTTKPFETEKETIKTTNIISPKKSTEKKLCVICKEYVEPKEINTHGKTSYECPKCGSRLSKGNM